MKVAVVAFWAGVGTRRFVLPVSALRYQVTVEVVLELGPVRHGTVPRVRSVWRFLGDSRFIVKGEDDFGVSCSRLVWIFPKLRTRRTYNQQTLCCIPQSTLSASFNYNAYFCWNSIDLCMVLLLRGLTRIRRRLSKLRKLAEWRALVCWKTQKSDSFKCGVSRVKQQFRGTRANAVTRLS